MKSNLLFVHLKEYTAVFKQFLAEFIGVHPARNDTDDACINYLFKAHIAGAVGNIKRTALAAYTVYRALRDGVVFGVYGTAKLVSFTAWYTHFLP